MTRKEQKSYSLLFTSETTLKDLIDNIYLKEYEHIEIYKRDSFICVKLTCGAGGLNGHIVVYTYDFDFESGLLMKVRQAVGLAITYEVIYDRIEECKKLIGDDWYKTRREVIKEMNKS